MTDPVWWLFLIWLPDFFKKTRNLDISHSWMHLATIYLIITILSNIGGWLPGHLMRQGWSVTRARKTSMFIFALCVMPILFVTHVGDWAAVFLIGLAGSAHQAWSANLWTLASDMFPRRAVASVAGIGACGGSVSMMFFGLFIGFVLQLTHGNYGSVFLLAGSAYLVAIAVIHLLAPKLAVVAID